MSMEAAFLAYATKRIADITLGVDMMEAGTLKTHEQPEGEQPVDTTDQTLGAYKAEREALQSLKGQIEAGESA